MARTKQTARPAPTSENTAALNRVAYKKLVRKQQRQVSASTSTNSQSSMEGSDSAQLQGDATVQGTGVTDTQGATNPQVGEGSGDGGEPVVGATNPQGGEGSGQGGAAEQEAGGSGGGNEGQQSSKGGDTFNLEDFLGDGDEGEATISDHQQGSQGIQGNEEAGATSQLQQGKGVQGHEEAGESSQPKVPKKKRSRKEVEQAQAAPLEVAPLAVAAPPPQIHPDIQVLIPAPPGSRRPCTMMRTKSKPRGGMARQGSRGAARQGDGGAARQGDGGAARQGDQGAQQEARQKFRHDQPPWANRPPPPPPPQRIPRKKRSGQRAFQEIKRYQKSVENLIPRAPFARMVRETMQMFDTGYRISAGALGGLQEAAEQMIVGLMEDTQLCAIHAKRVTIMAKDMQLAKRLRSDDVLKPG